HVGDWIARFLIVVVHESRNKKETISIVLPIENNAEVIKETAGSRSDGRIRTRLNTLEGRNKSLRRGVLRIARQQRAFPSIAAIEGLEHAVPGIAVFSCVEHARQIDSPIVIRSSQHMLRVSGRECDRRLVLTLTERIAVRPFRSGDHIDIAAGLRSLLGYNVTGQNKHRAEKND